jgi:two-component system sensor histidine kinase KdpD
VRRIDRRGVWRLAIVAIPSLALATLAVALLEDVAGVANASSAFIVAVVVTAVVSGTLGAVVTSVASFLLYDYFFVPPVHTFTVSDPGEWLGLVLLLFVGIVVGQLAALQRARAQAAQEGEREARALFAVSRSLAVRETTQAGLSAVVEVVRPQAVMARVWIALGGDEAGERVVADTAPGHVPAVPAIIQVLQRRAGDEGWRWLRVHRPTVRTQRGVDVSVFRVRIESTLGPLGSIYAARPRTAGEPTATETRLLASAADQVAQAVAHDRLAAESQAAEVARQSDALKSALLQSVSHDLRTPLATIRAAAGSLDPDSGLSPEEQRESAAAIDREVEYLDRLVTNLLDLSRIEAGALVAERDVYELEDLVGRSLERLGRRIGDRPIDVDLAAPPVEVDPTFLDEAVANVVENALKYTPPGAALRVGAVVVDAETVRLTLEDAGPGVPDGSLDRLFDKFYRVPGSTRRSRAGTGVGLAVVRGLVEATGGRVQARRSELGGLAIDLDLPRAPVATTVPAGG